MRLRPPDRGVRSAVALVLTGLALACPTTATAVTGPSLVRSTTVQGTTAPAPLVRGDWTTTNGVWQVELRTVAPPGGETVVSSSWRSAVFTARKGEVVFAARITLDQQPVPGTYRYTDDLRMCTAKRCYPWMSEASDAPPAWVDARSLPYLVEFGHGLTLTWKAPPAAIHVEWRYRQAQQGGNEARTTLRVAAGPGAKSV
jgi:hypothetical protein